MNEKIDSEPSHLAELFVGAVHRVAGLERDGANLAAVLQAWPATVDFLKRHLQ